jgi:hypothetical protein
VIDLNNVVQEVAENQISASFLGTSERCIREIPKSVSVQHIRTRCVIAPDGGSHDLGSTVCGFDDTKIEVVPREKCVFITHPPSCPVHAIVAEAELMLGISTQQLVNVPPEPAERLLRGLYVSQESTRYVRLCNTADIESGAVARELTRLVICQPNQFAPECEVAK